MREIPNALEILLDEQARRFPAIPPELVQIVYQIEERVQFDETRREAQLKIRQEVKLILDQDLLKGTTDGDAL